MLEFLPGNEGSGKGDKLPLLREWCKERVALGMEVYEIPVSVQELKLSSNQDWVIISTTEFTALVNSKSLLGKSLIDLIESLSGEGNRLVIIPKKSGRLGFAIAVDTDLKCYYSKQKDYEGLWIANAKAIPEVTQPEVSLKSLILDVSPTVSVTGTRDSETYEAEATSNGTKATNKGGKKTP